MGNEGFSEFMEMNKHDLLKEFSGYYKDIPIEQIEDVYPTEFEEFCKTAYLECEEIEANARIIMSQKWSGNL